MVDKSLVIPAEQLSAYERWELPTLGEQTVAKRPARPKSVATEDSRLQLPTAQELEAIRKSAYDEGFAQGKQEGYQTGQHSGQERGYQEGLQNAKAEVTAQAARLASVLNALTLPLKDQESVLEQDILNLVRTLAESVLDHGFGYPLEALLPLIRGILDRMAQKALQLNIQLNPQDAALLRTHLESMDGWQGHWNISENPMLTPGGCIVESAQQYVDARREVRQEEVWSILDAARVPA